MIIRFPLVVVQGSDTIRSVLLFKMVCEKLQQLVRGIGNKGFRECDN